MPLISYRITMLALYKSVEEWRLHYRRTGTFVCTGAPRRFHCIQCDGCSLVLQLIDWRAKDEKLIHAVKKCSSQTVRRLISGKSPAHPDKHDPNRGSTAYVYKSINQWLFGIQEGLQFPLTSNASVHSCLSTGHGFWIWICRVFS